MFAPLSVKYGRGSCPKRMRKMEKCVTGWTAVHVRYQVVASQLLAQDLEDLSSGGQLQQSDAVAIPRPGIGLVFVPECALQLIRIESQNNFTGIETLGVPIADTDWRHEKNAHYARESLRVRLF
jgi:hypothetical protein